MRMCVLDTETNGLFVGDFKPHALQMSYMILNSKGVGRGRIVERMVDRIIRISNETELSEESISIHGITRERSEKEGKEMKLVLDEWRDEIKKNEVKVLIGHNIEYDLKVLELESKRCGYSGLFGKDGLLGIPRGEEGIVVYCTAKESVGVCNIRMTSIVGRKYLKYGRLIEVHNQLFGEKDMERGLEMREYEKYLHDSQMDILVCARIYIKLSYGVDMYNEWKRILLRYVRSKELRRSARLRSV
jgi:DNA polymerase III epsilon subunit-like protein